MTQLAAPLDELLLELELEAPVDGEGDAAPEAGVAAPAEDSPLPPPEFDEDLR